MNSALERIAVALERIAGSLESRTGMKAKGGKVKATYDPEVFTKSLAGRNHLTMEDIIGFTLHGSEVSQSEKNKAHRTLVKLGWEQYRESRKTGTVQKVRWRRA